MAQVNLTNHFLIAMPNIGRSFLRAHPDAHLRAQRKGAVGVVVNRPIEMTLGACSSA